MKNPFSGGRVKFPIRFKFMIVLLLIVTSSLGVITFTMARLFDKDKTAYIYDLTSVISLHTSEEAESVIKSYQDKLVVFSQVIAEDSIPPDRKTAMLNKLFEEYRDFLMISAYEGDTEKFAIYDSKGIEDASLSKEELDAVRKSSPLPLESIRTGELYVENSSLPGKSAIMTMATVTNKDNPSKPFVLSAVIRLDPLLMLTRRSQVFETFLLDKNGICLAHSNSKYVKARFKPVGLPDPKRYGSAGSRSTTVEYSYDGTAMVGGFTRLDLAGITTVVQIPKATAYLTARELLGWLLAIVLVLLLASALFSIVWTQRLTRPIELLSSAAAQLGTGDFDIQVDVNSRDEIGELSQSFNTMAGELKTRETALKEAHSKLIQSEKMSAFGQIGAGIAHEVKNPLAGILGMTQLSLRKVEPDSPLQKNLQTIEKETKRCKNIIENLLKFARKEKTEFTPIHINSVLQDAVAIVDHQMGINQITLDVQLSDDLPTICGNANQLQQVFMNFMINSQQAMEGRAGTIQLVSKKDEAGAVQVVVKDNGPGIPDDIREKVFDPFFTTKPVGVGTGLGLSVSYGIIKDHSGTIRIESTPDQGTTFVVTLPTMQPWDFNQA